MDGSIDGRKAGGIMKLQAKFNLALAGAFALGLVLAAGLAYQITNANARREVRRQADLITSEGDGIGAYTVQEVAPLLAAAGQGRFAPQMIPFLAAQNEFRRVQKDWPAYSYRDVALNPTNPADQAADWQAELIQRFRADPKLNEFVVERDTPDGRILSVAKPIRIADPACLQCHSTPDKAPPVMVSLYGPNHGFGWRLGDTVAAQIVSVPMRVPIEHARRNFLYLLGSLAFVFLLMMLAMNLLLRRIIVKPVGDIAAMADEVSLGRLDIPEYAPKGRDEIASLAESFNRMRRSLVQAMKLLGD
jgi:protein-histidine pros-kinase